MTLKDFIIKWNNSHKHDYWWRQKHNITFDSEQHRNTTQVSIAFEYFEDVLANETLKKFEQDKEKHEHLKKTGQWIREVQMDKEKLKEDFENLDISQFN